MNFIPKLSEYDPEVASREGTLDPLGMGSIADRMGVKLVPGFRERMRRPRFLTSIAAGAHICRYFDKDTVATDGISEPWQVYEWYVVQALVKIYRNQENISLPGNEKATNALKSNVPLSAQRYLKSASVFGFHGIYKTLAEAIDLVKDGVLGEAGDILLRAWENEQNLTGFYLDRVGPGRNLRERLYNAVTMGLTKGAVAKEWTWNYFTNIATAFSLNGAGPHEKAVLYSIISGKQSESRYQVIQSFHDFLQVHSDDGWKENDFHDFILTSSYSYLKPQVHAIKIYEQFCRLLMDAFEDVLFFLSNRNFKISLSELSELPSIAKAVKLVPEVYSQVHAELGVYNESTNFDNAFNNFQFIKNKEDFVKLLLDHHVKIQSKKPPMGKLPWIENFEDGTYMVRPLYQRAQSSDPNIKYVHAYRTYPIHSFMKDLEGIL